jgi:hypothetical protein
MGNQKRTDFPFGPFSILNNYYCLFVKASTYIYLVLYSASKGFVLFLTFLHLVHYFCFKIVLCLDASHLFLSPYCRF